MLLELRVENYAVIDSAVVEFASGLNLLTGETGAGKSILIDALDLLLGDRASYGVVRHGAEKAVVSGVFEAANSKAAKLLEANGIDCCGEQLILRREISAGGKGRVFINNQPATLTVLKQLAPELATVHAQNESLLSFDAAERLRLLDRFGGVDAAEIGAAYERHLELAKRIAELERDEQGRLQLADVWSFQKKEIEQAELEIEEDVKLETEKRVLANAEKLYSAALSAHELLYNSSTSAATSLRAAGKNLEELSRFEPKFLEQLAALESARILVEDVGSSLRDYAEGIDASPQRLAQIEDRLALIERLKRKYGQTLEQVLAFGAQVGRKLSEIENRDELMQQLRKQVSAAAQEYLRLGHAISKRRQELARKLEKQVEAEINELAMKVKFKVELASSEQPQAWSATGFDQAAYLISTNPGEPLHALEKIASGGELSRVMLALNTCIESAAQLGQGKNAKSGVYRTVVFDEIDTGIGGRAAEAVGQKLKSLSASHQVLCITHLPQIACFADQHYVIEKTEKREAGATRVHTSIRLLNAAERTREIARMLSGAELTETSVKHAQQMLKAKA